MEQNNSVESVETVSEEPKTETYNSTPVSEQTAAVSEKPTGIRKTLNLTTAILSMAAIVFAFVFTFLIGVSVKVFGGNGMIIDSLKNIVDIFKALTNGDGAASLINIMFGTLFPIIILIAFIIVQLVYLILGVLRFVKVVKGEETKSMEKLAISSYIYYAFAASVIFALSGNVMLQFNPATYAGLIIGGLLISAIIVIKVLLRGKEMLKPSNLVPAILVAAAVIFAAVVAGLCCGPIASDAYPVDVMTYSVGVPGKAMAAMIGAIFAIVALGTAIEMMSYFLKYLIDGKLHKRAFNSSISLFIIMLISVICIYIGLSDISATRLIVATVFALFVMGCMIAHKVVCKEMAEDEKPANEIK